LSASRKQRSVCVSCLLRLLWTLLQKRYLTYM
jgi:hypothetical protein